MVVVVIILGSPEGLRNGIAKDNCEDLILVAAVVLLGLVKC